MAASSTFATTGGWSGSCRQRRRSSPAGMPTKTIATSRRRSSATLPADAPIMTDEIFGPILPVMRVKDVDQAIAFVNARPKPLALYLFTNDPLGSETSVLERTSSGGVTVNHVLLHLAVPSLPFGGVGCQRHRRLSRQGLFRDFQSPQGRARETNLA